RYVTTVHTCSLPIFKQLLFGNYELLHYGRAVNAFLSNSNGLHGGYLHRYITADLLIFNRAFKLYKYAQLVTGVDIGNILALGCSEYNAANFNFLADLADHILHLVGNRQSVHFFFQQLIYRIQFVFKNKIEKLLRSLLKIFIPSNKIRFTVNFKCSCFLAVIAYSRY